LLLVAVGVVQVRLVAAERGDLEQVPDYRLLLELLIQ
jgi:hypothetical protein